MVIRGFVPVAAMFSCLAFMMIMEVAADALSPVRGPLATAGGVFLVVMLACWLVIASIAVFNRPRFLVPPHLRDKRRL
ncbi:hypothetical protein [Streptomyces sp. NPDC056227]|uniref:hypothetical protein n=1 Tax=Streptomyces sp. NPDC056227 TaxID=3345753 RepID=UPI0035E0E32A